MWIYTEPPPVQILVVVAMIQTRSITLKTEVGKGSTGNAVYRGWVDPNRQLLMRV